IARPPTSYAGMSGGGIWRFGLRGDEAIGFSAEDRRLVGIAFYQTEERHIIPRPLSPSTPPRRSSTVPSLASSPAPPSPTPSRSTCATTTLSVAAPTARFSMSVCLARGEPAANSPTLG